MTQTKFLSNGIGTKVAITTLFAVLFAVLGPFGEYAHEPFAARLGNWTLDLFVGASIYLTCFHQLKGRFAEGLPGDAATVVLAALIGSLPMLAFMNMTEFLAGRGVQSSVYELALSYGESTIIAIMILSVFRLIDLAVERHEHRQPAGHDGLRDPNVPFLDRISDRIGRDLICLKMQDHYVRAQTKGGTHLVHMRFSDAIAELEDLPGFQPHRSWWVCADAISAVERHGNQHQLILLNGEVIPVARRRVAQLRRHGWLLPKRT